MCATTSRRVDSWPCALPLQFKTAELHGSAKWVPRVDVIATNAPPLTSEHLVEFPLDGRGRLALPLLVQGGPRRRGSRSAATAPALGYIMHFTPSTVS